MTDWKDKLWFADNLGMLREHIADECVPPFGSSVQLLCDIQRALSTRKEIERDCYSDHIVQ